MGDFILAWEVNNADIKWGRRKKIIYACLLFLETLFLNDFIMAVKMQIFLVFNSFFTVILI